MRFLFIDPAERFTAPIELSGEPVFSLHELTNSELIVSAALLIDGWPRWNEWMEQAKKTGELDLSHLDLDLDLEELQDAAPAWKVHGSLLFKSITSLPDLPPEQWACIECCKDHHITLTQRCLVYSYEPIYDHLLRATIGTSLRRIHQNICERQVDWLINKGICWGKEGNVPLLPCAWPDDAGMEGFEQHFCRRLSAGDTLPPTRDPKLAKLFTKGS